MQIITLRVENASSVCLDMTFHKMCNTKNVCFNLSTKLGKFQRTKSSELIFSMKHLKKQKTQWTLLPFGVFIWSESWPHKLILRGNKQCCKLLPYFQCQIFLPLPPSLFLLLHPSSLLSSDLSDCFFQVVFWRSWCKCCPWWLDLLGVENTNGTPDVFLGTEQGGRGWVLAV